MIGLVFSTGDAAGKGVAEYLVKELGMCEVAICKGSEKCYASESALLAGFREDVIYFDFLDYRLPSEVEFYIVLSRHSSEAGVKSYTVHATGNFSNSAPYGGRPRELGIAYPSVMWFLLKALDKLSTDFSKKGEYEISYEATHHGPTSLLKPIVFVEIGGTVNEWTDPTNHAVVGEAVRSLVSIYPRIPGCTPVIGLGGGHYARKHTEISLVENACYGHIASKYALDYLDTKALQAMILRSRDPIRGIIVEKKSTRREHRVLVEGFTQNAHVSLKYI